MSPMEDKIDQLKNDVYKLSKDYIDHSRFVSRIMTGILSSFLNFVNNDT